MYNHAPSDYICPMCGLLKEVKEQSEQAHQRAIVYQSDQVTVLMPTHWYKHNYGQVIIIPNAHYENIYDLPDELGAEIHKTAKRIAFALKKAFGCEGVSTRQHNEPAGNQDMWHYHLHVFPRYTGDNLYLETRQPNTAETRFAFAEKLRAAL
jgi:histidine triad (HIT) family protein